MRSILLLLGLIGICIATELNSDGLLRLEQQNCGVAKESLSVVEGDEVISGSRPWMALIKTNLSNSMPYSCLGTLITNQFVLAAAHCVYENAIESVRLGEHQLTTDEDCIKGKKTQCLPNIESFGVERVIIHEEYKDIFSFPNDIALLKLNRKVDFKDHISPICLPINAILGKQATQLETFLLTAWGDDKSGTKNYLLREITVENRQNCAKPGRINVEDLICFFKDENVLCKGISGSPLSKLVEYSGLKRFVQFAVVTAGSGCNSSFGVNIAKFMPWITNVLAKES